jgi:UDP-N-acetylmuramyl pentapeptide phosphotransferase/UDP-N-acetylglucosamine-1-phosphate transferase
VNSVASPWLAPLVAAFATFLFLGWLLRSGFAQRLALDHPNPRSLHRRPTPRVGGLGILLGILLALPVVPGPTLLLAACTLALAAVSYVDDRLHLPATLRFAAQLAAAAAWVLAAAPGSAAWLVAVLVVAIAWAANLYNFMDGADGLAGGMAVIGFAMLALAAAGAGRADLAWLCASVAAAALGFLWYNFPPARLFMGDAGSVPLGFLAGAVASSGWREGVWPLWLPVMVFAPFVVDATVTLVRRLLDREKVWQAHRDHYYQRLIRMGWSHRRTALAEYALMVALGIAGLVLTRLDGGPRALGLVAAAALVAALIAAIEIRWRLHLRTPEHA